MSSAARSISRSISTEDDNGEDRRAGQTVKNPAVGVEDLDGADQLVEVIARRSSIVLICWMMWVSERGGGARAENHLETGEDKHDAVLVDPGFGIAFG